MPNRAERHIRLSHVRRVSRHINILYLALYREDKKHVCSSAYQMLSPSLFMCQLNATSAPRRRTPRLLVGVPLDSSALNLPTSSSLWSESDSASSLGFLAALPVFIRSFFSSRASSANPSLIFSSLFFLSPCLLYSA